LKQDLNELCGDKEVFMNLYNFLKTKRDNLYFESPCETFNDDKTWLYKANINTKFDINKLIFKSEEIIEKYKLSKPHL
jgi:hypothetical protein